MHRSSGCSEHPFSGVVDRMLHMIRSLWPALPALYLLSACASSTPAPIEYPDQPGSPLRPQQQQRSTPPPGEPASLPPTPESYLSAPPPPSATKLFICSGAVSNAGPVSEAG